MAGVDHAQVQALIEARRWADAESLAAAGLASDPGDSDGWCLLSLSQAGQGRTAEALDAASRGTAADPANGWTYRCAAVAAYALGLSEEAEGAAVTAIEVDARDWRAYLLLAAVLDNPERRSDGWLAAMEAVRLAPDEAPVHEMVGRLALGFSWQQHAEAAFGRALALDPTSDTARRGLAATRAHGDPVSEGAGQLLAALSAAPASKGPALSLEELGWHAVRRALWIGLIIGLCAAFLGLMTSPVVRGVGGLGLGLLWWWLATDGLTSVGGDRGLLLGAEAWRPWLTVLRAVPQLRLAAASAALGVLFEIVSTPFPRATAGVLLLSGAGVLILGSALLFVHSVRSVD